MAETQGGSGRCCALARGPEGDTPKKDAKWRFWKIAAKSFNTCWGAYRHGPHEVSNLQFPVQLTIAEMVFGST
jgi:hypothetical protein